MAGQPPTEMQLPGARFTQRQEEIPGKRGIALNIGFVAPRGSQDLRNCGRYG